MDNVLSVVFSDGFLSTIIRVGVPLMFAALSAYIASLSGMPNIAIEGIMLFSALMAVMGSFWTQSAWLGLLIAVLTGMLIALLMAGLTMKLGTMPILVGIALNTFAASFTVFLLYIFTGSKGSTSALASKVLPTVRIEWLEDVPVLGAIFSGHYMLAYFCFACIILVAILVYKTPFGLHMKAAGLDAAAAKSVGINVNRVRLIAMLLSGLFAALGGAYLTMGYLSSFTRNMVAGRGWIGIAAQAMGGSNLLGVGVSTFMFSVFQAIANVFSLYNILPSDIITAIPYFGVFLGMVLFSIFTYRRTKKKKND